jgi:hypothetical protein
MSEEIKKLEARIAELEGKLGIEPPPAPKPFVSKPYQPPDYTENASPPIRLTERERAGPMMSLEDSAKMRSSVGTLRPLAEFLNGGRPDEPPKAAPVATTTPLGKVPGIDAIDAIAKAFADREKLEELAKLVDVATKLGKR